MVAVMTRRKRRPLSIEPTNRDRARLAVTQRKRYQKRIPGTTRGQLVTLLTPSQRDAVRHAALVSGESISFVLAAIVAAYFGD